VTNNIIVENQSINDEGDGGGIAVVGSSPFIANNLIARNTATRNGGGYRVLAALVSGDREQCDRSELRQLR